MTDRSKSSGSHWMFWSKNGDNRGENGHLRILCEYIYRHVVDKNAEHSLPKLYAAIMVFSAKVRHYFEARCRVYLPLYDFIMMLKQS